MHTPTPALTNPPEPFDRATTDTDVVVIGAGPVGLFQVFQLGLLGLRCELVDVLPEAGGQCVALYPDKPIYDVPGVPLCTGRELAALLLAQASPFLPLQADGTRRHLHLGEQVESLQTLAPTVETGPRFALRTSGGNTLHARAVVVAAGAGAFVPRTMPLPGWTGSMPPANLHHHLPPPAARGQWVGQHVVVCGAGDEALQCALELSQLSPDQAPARVTLLHRRDAFQAEPALEEAVRERIAQGQLHLALGLVQGVSARHTGDKLATAAWATGSPHELDSLQLLTPQGTSHTLALDQLLVRQGLSPKLGPLADWGLPLERKQVRVNPATGESATPGIFAVGDISTCEGKKRLLLCGFHEATMAAHHVLSVLKPDEPQHLLYTTTSPVLQQRLGVST